MQFTIHAAKTQLSKLIDAALAGEEVVIAKGSKPVVRLVPPANRVPVRTARGPGELAPRLPGAMSEEDLKLCEGG